MIYQECERQLARAETFQVLTNATYELPELGKVLKDGPPKTVAALIALGDGLRGNNQTDSTPRPPYSTRCLVRDACASYLANVLNEIRKTPELARMAVGWSALDDREPFLQRAEGLRDAHLFNELWPQAVLAEDKLTGLVGSKRIGLAGDKLPDTTKQAQLNRLILEALYGGEYFLDCTSPEPALCWSQDQWARLIWMLGGLAAFACGCFIDMNTTSLHGFYKQKLQDAYVVRDTALLNLNSCWLLWFDSG